MEKSTKKRIARTLGVGMPAVLYTALLVAMVRVATQAADSSLTASDSGIILEIIGFILFLSVIRTRLSKTLGEVYPEWGEKTIRQIIELFSILTIIAGLILQLSLFQIPFLE